jgi:hypothetical protein
MDHLFFSPNKHVIDYRLPRVCFATTKDFKFVVANDLDRKILRNIIVFGRRHVSYRQRKFIFAFFFKGNAVGEAPTAILVFLKIRTQIRVCGDLNLGGWVVHQLP